MSLDEFYLVPGALKSVCAEKERMGNFMKRILLALTILLITTPAFASVNIAVTQENFADPAKLTVSYNCTAGEPVRAFALEMTLGSEGDSMTFFDINDFNRGESTTPGGGYGIFPGWYKNLIDPGNPDWYQDNYTPVAPPNNVDTNGTGPGTRKIIVELGTLYKDANAPGTSGTLFTVRVDPNGKFCDSLNVVANTIRGGVVLENGSQASTNLPLAIACYPPPIVPPATLTYPAADGNNGRYQVSWAAANADGYKLDRSANAGGTWTNIYTGAATTVCDDVNTGSYRYRVCSTKAGVGDSAWNEGASDCNVVLCFPTSEPNMTTWKALGKPRCWCCKYQCRGDADCSCEGTTKTGIYCVGIPDLNIFMKAWQVKEPTFGPGLQGEPNICADFDHLMQGTIKTGIYRVGVPDLSIFMKAWQVKEPTHGSGIGTCPAGPTGSRFTLPTDYKPCN